MPTSLDDIQRELMGIFQAELEEHIATLNHGLLALEQSPVEQTRQELLNQLFRAAHSLKGAARAVGLAEIAQLSHRLEDALDTIRQGRASFNPSIYDTLLAAIDAFPRLMAAHLNGLDQPVLEGIYTQLEALTAGALLPPAQPRSIPDNQPVIPDPDEADSDIHRAASLQAAPAAVEKANSIDHLPRLTLEEKPGITPRDDTPAVISQPVPASAPPPRAPAEDTIRVATHKLDSLMDSMGELMVARMRDEELCDHLRKVNQRTAAWRKRWGKTAPYYRRLQRRVVADEATGPDSSLRSSGPNAEHPGQEQSDDNLRVDIKRLLEYLAHSESELKALSADINALSSRANQDANFLQLVTDDLQNGLRQARMQPVTTLFDFFPRLVRDLARERGQEIGLRLQGQETEVDRQVLELMKDPLTHLVRNAIDHGLEYGGERVAAGKPAAGVVSLSAEQRGDHLVLEVADDGRGIDLLRLRQVAVRRGLLSEPDASTLTDGEALDLIFLPGFSTASQVSEVSGRGVGLDVVRKNVEKLRGLIQVRTQPGKGTCISLLLPLTLSTTHVLLVRAANQTLAIPLLNIERVLRLQVSQIRQIDGRPAIYSDGKLLPLVSLARVLSLPFEEKQLPAGARLPVMILAVVEKRFAVRVDAFLEAQEVMVKPLGHPLRRLRHVIGGAILGNGEVVTILNAAGLLRSIQSSALEMISHPLVFAEVRPRRVMVVDDSITTRSLEKHILENAGYHVSTAADGIEAWQILCDSREPTPDVIVTDVNMPRMDGFQLTEAIRGNDHLTHLPVVLVTSLEAAQDRLRGLEAGADAYIVKSAFDQHELLTTLERLVG